MRPKRGFSKKWLEENEPAPSGFGRRRGSKRSRIPKMKPDDDYPPKYKVYKRRRPARKKTDQ